MPWDRACVREFYCGGGGAGTWRSGEQSCGGREGGTEKEKLARNTWEQRKKEEEGGGGGAEERAVLYRLPLQHLAGTRWAAGGHVSLGPWGET